MTSSKPTTVRTPPAAGTLCLILGFMLAVLVIAVRLHANWGVIGRVVARNPVICWGLALSLMTAGVVMIKQHTTKANGWSPRIPGRRFRDAVLYTRLECPLCHEAALTLSSYEGILPELKTIDVDAEPEVLNAFGNCVPVLVLDGKVRFRGHVNETLLQRLIDGPPPVDLEPIANA